LLAIYTESRERRLEPLEKRGPFRDVVRRDPQKGTDLFEDRAGLPHYSDASHGLRGLHDVFDSLPHMHGYGLPPPLAIPVVPAGVPSTQPMSSAPMRYAADGAVDWGTVWDS